MSFTVTVTSRKSTWVVEDSMVNLIVGWLLFKCATNSSKESWPCGQIMKISSMYRFHNKGCIQMCLKTIPQKCLQKTGLTWYLLRSLQLGGNVCYQIGSCYMVGLVVITHKLMHWLDSACGPLM